jgi:hypothetical protein
MIDKIEIDGYSPEEYASFWGCDPQYCLAPQLPNDGYSFYNFSSDKQERTKEWLTEFRDAIQRLIERLAEGCLIIPLKQYHIDYLADRKKDMEELDQLKDHVEKLIQNNP